MVVMDRIGRWRLIRRLRNTRSTEGMVDAVNVDDDVADVLDSRVCAAGDWRAAASDIGGIDTDGLTRNTAFVVVVFSFFSFFFFFVALLFFFFLLLFFFGLDGNGVAFESISLDPPRRSVNTFWRLFTDKTTDSRPWMNGFVPPDDRGTVGFQRFAAASLVGMCRKNANTSPKVRRSSHGRLGLVMVKSIRAND